MKPYVFKKVLVFMVGMYLSGAICASVQNPVDVLKDIVVPVTRELKAHQSEFKQNPQKVYAIVNKLIVPNADFDEMGRWVAGRQAWENASSEDKAAFLKEFKKLVVNTYISALMRYSNQVIEFQPLRGDIQNKERVVVNSLIREPHKSAIKVDYKLLRKGENWQVYDIIIEGVSLIKGYQAQFSGEIRQNGLPSTTEKIRAHLVPKPKA